MLNSPVESLKDSLSIKGSSEINMLWINKYISCEEIQNKSMISQRQTMTWRYVPVAIKKCRKRKKTGHRSDKLLYERSEKLTKTDNNILKIISKQNYFLIITLSIPFCVTSACMQ